MHVIDPASMLAVHHAEHRQSTLDARAARPRRSRALTRRLRAAYIAVLRRAYVRARAAQARSAVTQAA